MTITSNRWAWALAIAFFAVAFSFSEALRIAEGCLTNEEYSHIFLSRFRFIYFG